MRLVFASFLLSGCVLLRAGDCGGSAQGGGGTGGAVNSGGLGGGAGAGGSGAGPSQVCSAACNDKSSCECADYVQPADKPPTCEVDVVQLEGASDVGAIAVSGYEIAWVARSETSLSVGRLPATGAWTIDADAIQPLGDVGIAEVQLGRFGPIEGGGFFFRFPATKTGYLCWPEADCEGVTSELEIRDLRVQSGRMAIAAESHVCFTELPDGTPKETVSGQLAKLTTADCQGVPGNSQGPAFGVRVAFADAAGSRVWLTARGDQGGAVHLLEGVNGAPGGAMGENVAATDGALSCGDDPRTLLMKQCSFNDPPACTLEMLTADSAMPSNVPTNTVVPPDLDSKIAADRDYFYFSTPGNINAVVRSAEKTVEIPLPTNSSAVLSMDASHEDYLYFTFWEKDAMPVPKFFLGRWLKQKLTP